MIEIGETIVSDELFTARFCCDIAACKGECCVEGNAGAPLDQDEIAELEQNWERYKPYMKPEGIQAVEQQGIAVLDLDGDLTTPLIDDAECAYSINENGATWCAIEKAWSRGECSYRKPISCHLYPIRLVNFSNGTIGLQYHRWNICRSAELLGQKRGEPLFKVMREPLIRRFGEQYYKALEQVNEMINDQK